MIASTIQQRLVAGSAAVILALTAGVADAQETWKVQTSMTAGESYYQNIEKYWLPKLAAMTSGELTIELTPVGSVVPYNETMDAIGAGRAAGRHHLDLLFRRPQQGLLGDGRPHRRL